MISRNSRVKLRALTTASAAVVAFALAAGLAGTAYAQDSSQSDASAPKEIVVTGSRIMRRDFQANSPIVTLQSQTLEQSANVGLEASLQKLPQFSPAQNQFGGPGGGSQNVQPGPTSTPGAATLSLRGLGSNRNLVLLDGRRAMPVNASMAVDINSIPASAIDRVEVITGGASAVYGADAVGGVVNFILKKDFQGLELDAQYGLTEIGDDREFKVSGLMGTNFANSRGNVMFGIERVTRSKANESDRAFFTKGWADPTTPGSEYWYQGTWYNPVSPPGNAPSQAAIDSIFTQVPGQVPTTARFFLNPDGTVFSGLDLILGQAVSGYGSAGSYRAQGVDGRNLAYRDEFGLPTGTRALKQNITNDLVTLPLDRNSLFGSGHFDINDNVTAFFQGYFSNVQTQTVLFPASAVGGFSVSIPHGSGIVASTVDGSGNTLPQYLPGGSAGLSCPAVGGCTASEAYPVPAELATLLDSRANPNANWNLNTDTVWGGSRGTTNDNTTYQLLAGLNGTLPNSDWTWEIFGSQGRTNTVIKYDGFTSIERYRTLAQSPNYGQGASYTANSEQGGFAGASVTCTSGIPFFGGAISADCLNAITANMQATSTMEQNNVEANLQGGLFSLPAGKLQFSLGADYRENTYTFDPDSLNATNSYLDGVIGVRPAGRSKGSTDVKEVYGEFLVPVLSQLPLVKQLNLELGWRYSSYDTVGGLWTYKALADYQVNDYVRFRGGYNLANRAPNINELYLAKTQTFSAEGGTAYGDPCALTSPSPWGAADGTVTISGVNYPVVNTNGATGAAATRSICSALMGSTGTAAYYAGPTSASEAVQRPAGAAGVYSVGNPNVQSEKAKTFTAGVVLRSPFTTPAFSRITASVDWYSIDIQNAITLESRDEVEQHCFSLDYNPTSDPNSASCQLVQRDPITGAAGSPIVTYTNQATIKTSGIDMQLNWSMDLADMWMMKNVPGSLSVNVLVNYLNEFATQATPTSPWIHWEDSLGPNFVGLQPGSYQYKTYTTATYSLDAIQVGLRWRHLPSAQAVTAPPAAAGGAPNYVLPVAAHDQLDLFGNWSISKNLKVRAGINNLLDAQPEITGARVASPNALASTGQGITNQGLYDVLGRRFYVGVKVQY